MARTVFCQYLKKDADGLDFQLYPGPVGLRIYQNISKQAWQAWQAKQIMLINEKRLNMMNPEHRAELEQAMVKFLFEGEEIHIEGYTPPKS